MKSLKCMEIANRMCVCLCVFVCERGSGGGGNETEVSEMAFKGVGEGCWSEGPYKGGNKSQVKLLQPIAWKERTGCNQKFRKLPQQLATD